jgi:hypothetical protein
MDETLAALRQSIDSLAAGAQKPGVRFLVYPPEWEAPMQARFKALAEVCEAAGRPVELVDLGCRFLEAVDSREGAADALLAQEDLGTDVLLGDLSLIATRTVTEVLLQPLPSKVICRLLYNLGSLATFASFSSITNSQDLRDIAPAVLAFPGEGDDHSLSLLNLRTDTDYRIPRL